MHEQAKSFTLFVKEILKDFFITPTEKKNETKYSYGLYIL
jgi:hypothetical protein